MSSQPVARVLFVCLGNICRSPTAEGVFRSLVYRAALATQVQVDSAGTGDWHVGRPPDPRAIDAARRRGIDLSGLRARQVDAADFDRFDWILAMDRANLAALNGLRPPGYGGHLGLFLDFAPELGLDEVPDPYCGGPRDFSRVIDLVERAGEGLLASVRELRTTWSARTKRA